MKTIFVSSTFKDMHYERDIIQDIVAPKINTEAQKYGESVSFCDLRWGIDTSKMEDEIGSRKVLDVCLNEIDRCRPPFVVILGYRYGWIPDNQLIENVAGSKQMMLDDLNVSVTALEIEYGALRNSEREQNTFFYFREIEGEAPEDYMSEDPEHAEKLKELKERIMRIAGDRVKTYTVTYNGAGFDGMREFGEMVYRDIAGYLSAEWESLAALSEYEREKIIHDNYMREKALQFKAREEIARKLIDGATAADEPYGIVAESGLGKTTMLSYVVNKMAEEGAKTLIVYGGLTSGACSGEGVLRIIISFLEKILGITPMSEEEFKQYIIEAALNENDTAGNLAYYYNRLIRKVAKLGDEKIVIAIDAINQLGNDDCVRKYLLFPKKKPDNIVFFVSSDNEEDFGGIWGHSILEGESEDYSAMVRGIVKSQGRELDERVIKAIIDKNLKSPLYLRLIVQRLSLMRQEDFDNIRSHGDGMDAITEHQIELVESCPRDIGKLCAEIIRIAGERINPEFVEDAAALISISEKGLRPSDLAGIMGDNYNALDLAHLLSYMSENFIIRDDGRIDYSNGLLSLRYKGFKGYRIKREYHERIYQYMKTMDLADDICADEITEHLVHAYGTKMNEELYNLINRVLESKLYRPKNALINTLYKRYRSDASLANSFIDYIEENIKEEAWPVMKVLIDACNRFEKSEYRTGLEIMLRILAYERKLLNENESASLCMHVSYVAYYMAKFIACKEDDATKDITDCYLYSIQYDKKAYEIDNTRDIRNNVASSYERIASLYKDYFDYAHSIDLIAPDDNKGLLDDNISDELKTILCFFLKSIELRRELYSEKKDGNSGRKLIAALTGLGDFLSYSVSYNRVEKLVRISKELYREALGVHEELLEDEVMGKTYKNSVASYKMYYRVGNFMYSTAEDPVDCVNYLLKAYWIAEEIYEQEKNLESLRRLGDIARMVAFQYRQSPVSEKLQKSIKYFKYAKEYKDKIFHITRHTEDYYELGWARLDLATAMEICVREDHDLGEDDEYVSGAQDELYGAKHIFDFLRDERGYSREYSELARLKLVDVARLFGGSKNDHVVNKLIEEVGQPYPSNVSKELAYAYAEVLELLTYMNMENMAKMNVTTLKLLDYNKDRSYVEHMDPNKTLLEQDLSPDAIALMTLFTLSYFSNSDQAMAIKAVLDANEKEYQASKKE